LCKVKVPPTDQGEHSNVVEKEPPRNRVKYPVRKRNGGS
jgi:hypothetical protein